MIAEIITIGDEILIGQIVDTNSAWLAQQLNDIGVDVRQITSISDSRRHIIAALDTAKKKADLIIITGGLGPTADDITKPTLAEYFGTKLVRNQELFEHVKFLIERHGFEMTENNAKQADIPANCTPLSNENGTAAGMWFEQDGKIFISMPGVPFEMKNITEKQVLPKLKTQFSLPSIVHRTIQTFGVAESILANKINSWESALPSSIKLAYLPSPERVRLRLSYRGTNQNDTEKTLDKLTQGLKVLLGDTIFGMGNIFLENAIADLLKGSGKTVATAESCTGGNVAKLITSVPGSSAYFEGGVVAYSNRIKEEILKVNRQTLITHGAVSEATVQEMATGIRQLYQSDFGVAVSGIAGPSGGSPEKPVGTVWVAVSSENETVTRLLSLGNKRDITVRRASAKALDMLRRLIIKTNA